MIKDLTNRVVGRLTVLRFAGLTEQGKAVWVCRCLCGKEVEIRSGSLISSRSKSCGCAILRDLTGLVFGRLTALRRVDPTWQGKAMWECICECGKSTTVQGYRLTANITQSCGCWKSEISAAWAATLGVSQTGENHPMFGRRGKDSPVFKHGHGIRTSLTYRSWQGLNQRCTNPNSKRWFHYGGSGVKVDPRWRGEHGFENFLADLGERPSSKHSISRFLDSGNYEPGNVEWATDAEQKAEARGKRAMLAFRKYNQSQLVAA